ncbi:8549_t:CDS:2, partial [Ambispora leptoticha]
DLFNKVLPYKDILPNDICQDILRSQFIPSAPATSAPCKARPRGGTGQLIGGYNDVPWSNVGGWVPSHKSFIFSLGDGTNISDSILSRVHTPHFAIYDSSDRGPIFGSWDLGMGAYDHPFDNEASCNCQQHHYERNIMESTDRFAVEEYEVFRVDRKIDWVK